MKKILIVGDVMLDRYWFGKVNRISPEAPVPIVHVQREDLRPGGAANVAANIVALGGKTTLIGVVGKDEAGEKLAGILKERAIDPYLYVDDTMPTTLKLRVIGHQQQMIRLDFEQKPDAGFVVARDEQFKALLPDADVVVLSDYGKGVLLHGESLIALAKAAGKPVIVDPKGRDWERYRGATLVSPNRGELREMVGEWASEADLTDKVQKLRAMYNFDSVLVTRSEEGMTLFDDEGRFHVQTRAQEVYDVSGAGDTVIGTLALMLAEGYPRDQAVMLANRAAGIVVGKLGTATVSREELFPPEVAAGL